MKELIYLAEKIARLKMSPGQTKEIERLLNIVEQKYLLLRNKYDEALIGTNETQQYFKMLFELIGFDNYRAQSVEMPYLRWMHERKDEIKKHHARDILNTQQYLKQFELFNGRLPVDFVELKKAILINFAE